MLQMVCVTVWPSSSSPLTQAVDVAPRTLVDDALHLLKSTLVNLTPLRLSKSTILLPPTPSTHSGPWMCSSSDGCSALTSLVLYNTYTTTLSTTLLYYCFLSYELSLRSSQFTRVEHGYLNTRCCDKS